MKRQAEEDESRGWKNKDKKRKKNKVKKNKKHAESKEIVEMDDKAHEVEKKEVKDKPAAETPAPFTSGLQFSAYSSAPRPSYRPPRPLPAQILQDPDDSMIMYGLDSQGKPQYINEAAMAEVLQTPQAVKVPCKHL